MILFMVSTIIWRRGKRRNVWKESCRVSRAMMLWWVVDFRFSALILHECPDTQKRWENVLENWRIVEAQLIEHPSTYLKFFHVFHPQDSNNESLEKLIKQYSQMFDLSLPMKGCVMNQSRYLFLEGDMKFKDNIGKVRETSDLLASSLTNQLELCIHFSPSFFSDGRPLFPSHRHFFSL